MGLQVVPVALTVSMDEPALILYEVNQPAPDSQSVRRYRHIVVVRGDKPATYTEDLGLASNFGEQVSIPGGVAEGGQFQAVHTVGELIDYARELGRKPFDVESIAREDLIGGYHDVADMRRRVLAGETP